ncbi:diacylglycerol/lipid kinase family protein [Parvularcula dongshanensis]|uniref:Diacylglycerol kinase family enzyme n=1 Tax=Parvularcula dongshanensis TaxID=1173995 RepID=A0A840I2R7_9PROT|nr:diacylglycerol kinase family protein [Parvularcula dongshanensis]MBB4659037.1 diacylglycerol kinase family enzyme [Parvularcula dongshanensis]
MRVTVVHNENAGDGESSGDELVRLLGRHGHEARLTRREDMDDALDAKTDLVAAVGGDGTVDAVARLLAKTGLPLAILPAGSANNIARCLGVPLDVDEAVASWPCSAVRTLDMIEAKSAAGRVLTIESAGLGAVTAGLRAAHEEDHEGGEDKLAFGRNRTAETVREAPPIGSVVSLDGEVLPGCLLAIEVLNLTGCGPRLTLAPRADPEDGLFDVLLVQDDERRDLAAWLRAGRGAPPGRSRRARTMTIRGQGDPFRVGDTFLETAGETSLRVLTGALRVLVPDGGGPTHDEAD